MNLFVDTSLGGKRLCSLLREHLEPGEQVRRHNELFSQAAEDTHWMAELDRKGGFVVLTKDRRISHRVAELVVLSNTRLGLFIYVSNDHTVGVVANAFRLALPRIRQASHTCVRPFVAKVYADGRSNVFLDPDGIRAILHKHRLHGRE